MEISGDHSLLTTGVIPQIKFVDVERTNEDSQKIKEEAKANLQQAKLRLQEEVNRYQVNSHESGSVRYQNSKISPTRRGEQLS